MPYVDPSCSPLEEMLQPKPGSHEPRSHLLALLLAALHSQMERMNNAVRVCKAASKTPHSRTSTDIQLKAAETQDILLLNREGPAVHRELCHVVQALQLKQMEALRLPGHHKSAVFGHVRLALSVWASLCATCAEIALCAK